MATNQAPNQNPYDPPFSRPPNLNDFNGAGKVDDAFEPPDPTTMPNSGEWNTIEFTEVAFGIMIPLAEVSVLASATPSISNVLSPVTAYNGSASAFYLTRNAAGDYTVEVGRGGTFPAFNGNPKGFINAQISLDVCIGAVNVTGPNGHPAARVTTTVGGTLTDVNFTVQIR